MLLGYFWYISGNVMKEKPKCLCNIFFFTFFFPAVQTVLKGVPSCTNPHVCKQGPTPLPSPQLARGAGTPFANGKVQMHLLLCPEPLELEIFKGPPQHKSRSVVLCLAHWLAEFS